MYRELITGTEYRLKPQDIDNMTFPQLQLYFEKPQLSLSEAIRLANKNAEKKNARQ